MPAVKYLGPPIKKGRLKKKKVAGRAAEKKAAKKRPTPEPVPGPNRRGKVTGRARAVTRGKGKKTGLKRQGY